jgi:hypothetical protein
MFDQFRDLADAFFAASGPSESPAIETERTDTQLAQLLRPLRDITHAQAVGHNQPIVMTGRAYYTLDHFIRGTTQNRNHLGSGGEGQLRDRLTRIYDLDIGDNRTSPMTPAQFTHGPDPFSNQQRSPGFNQVHMRSHLSCQFKLMSQIRCVQCQLQLHPLNLRKVFHKRCGKLCGNPVDYGVKCI